MEKITAINPKNKHLYLDGYYAVYSQGELLFELRKQPADEVFLDYELPGNIHPEVFYNILIQEFPHTSISFINKPEEKLLAEAIKEEIMTEKRKEIFKSVNFAYAVTAGLITALILLWFHTDIFTSSLISISSLCVILIVFYFLRNKE